MRLAYRISLEHMKHKRTLQSFALPLSPSGRTPLTEERNLRIRVSRELGKKIGDKVIGERNNVTS